MGSQKSRLSRQSPSGVHLNYAKYFWWSLLLLELTLRLLNSVVTLTSNGQLECNVYYLTKLMFNVLYTLYFAANS